MIGINSCTIVGNVSDEPKLRQSKAGKPVLNFIVAIPESWHEDEDRQHVEYVPVAIWGAGAERLAPLVRKGTRVAVSGRYTTISALQPDGSKSYWTKITAENVVLMGGHPRREAQS